MSEKSEEKVMALIKENEHLKFQVDELRKNFLTLKIEMDTQEEHIKRITDLNKLLLPKLDLENIANSFFNYLKEILGYDQCGIIVKNKKFFFLNNTQSNKLELQKTLDDEETNNIIDLLYKKLVDTKMPVTLDKEKVNEITNNKINSLVALPLINNDELLGLIVLESRLENIYTEKEIKLITELTKSMPEIIENAIHFSEINEIAIKDSITGLYNKQYFDTKMEIKYIKPKQAFSVILLDIRNLKRINSLYGNATGDEVLKEIGKILKLFSYKKYIASRYEGSIFSLLLPGYSLHNAEEAANKIKHYLIEKNILKLDLEYSFGISVYQENLNLTKEQVLQNADTALSSAKILGKNKIMTFKLNN